MNRPAIFSAGIPTGTDVRKIRDIYPDSDLEVGQKIDYQDVADIIGVDVSSSRFKTVTSAWRRAVERESGLFIGTDPGKAFCVMTESDKLQLAGSKYRQSLRSSRRACVVTSVIDRKQLTDDEARTLTFVSERSAKILNLSRLKREQILPEI